MKKIFKLYSILFLLFVIIVFFFIGVSYAVLIGAGENKGLASGAIVLGYGVQAAFFSLLVAIWAVLKLSRTSIIKLIKLLGFIIIGFIAYFMWRYHNDKPDAHKTDQQQMPTTGYLIIKADVSQSHSIEPFAYRKKL